MRVFSLLLNSHPDAVTDNLRGKGEVYSYTTIYEASSGDDASASYTVALVKLDEGPTVTTQLTDIDNGMIVYGYKIQPTMHQPQPMA
jgi:uncharacterized protein